VHGINSCLWINQLNDIVATAALQTFKFIFMKHLSRDEMKKIVGGYWHEAEVYCNDGSHVQSTNYCSNSVGVCNGHGGFNYCRGAYMG